MCWKTRGATLLLARLPRKFTWILNCRQRKIPTVVKYKTLYLFMTEKSQRYAKSQPTRPSVRQASLSFLTSLTPGRRPRLMQRCYHDSLSTCRGGIIEGKKARFFSSSYSSGQHGLRLINTVLIPLFHSTVAIVLSRPACSIDSMNSNRMISEAINTIVLIEESHFG